MELKESERVETRNPAVRERTQTGAGKRILCVGKIHKGRKTMIFAFLPVPARQTGPRKGGNEDVTVSQGREEEGKA